MDYFNPVFLKASYSISFLFLALQTRGNAIKSTLAAEEMTIKPSTNPSKTPQGEHKSLQQHRQIEMCPVTDLFSKDPPFPESLWHNHGFDNISLIPECQTQMKKEMLAAFHLHQTGSNVPGNSQGNAVRILGFGEEQAEDTLAKPSGTPEGIQTP